MPRPASGLPAPLVLLLAAFGVAVAGAVLVTLQAREPSLREGDTQAQSASPTNVVRVRVVDAGGAALANRTVEVALDSLECSEAESTLVTLDAAGRGDARFVRVPAGAAVLTVDSVLRPGSEERDARPSEPALLAVPVTRSADEVTLHLLPAAPLEVIVLSAAGGPVAGAYVHAPRAWEAAGPDGVARFPALLSIAPLVLRAEDPATLARGEVTVDIGALDVRRASARAPRRVEVRLDPAPPHGALLVRFVDEGGRPLPLRHAPTVEFITWDPMDEWIGGPRDHQLPVTSHLVPALRPSRWHVGADCFEEGRCYAIGTEVDIEDGETAIVDLVVPRARRISGRVLGGGRPVEGAWAKVDFDAEAPCDAEGRFAGFACNQDVYWRAGAPGWRERTGCIKRGEDPGSLEIDLEPGASLRVLGRYPDGRPAARADVVVWREGADRSFVRRSLDHEGETLISLDDAAPHWIFVAGALRRIEGKLLTTIESDVEVPFPTPATDPWGDVRAPAKEALPRIAARVVADGALALDAEVVALHDDPRYEGGLEDGETVHRGVALVTLGPHLRAIQVRAEGRAPSPWLPLEGTGGARLVTLALGPVLPPGATAPPVPAPTRPERAAEMQARSESRRVRRPGDLRRHAPEERPSGTASLRGFCADGRLDSELTLEGPSGYMDLDPFEPFVATRLAPGRWTLLSRGRALSSFDLHEGEVHDLGSISAP